LPGSGDLTDYKGRGGDSTLVTIITKKKKTKVNILKKKRGRLSKNIGRIG